MSQIDLHIHSSISDGTLTPYQIIDIATESGVRFISITDHDSINAYTTDLINYASLKNINLIKGIEISTNYNGIGIHVLGYNIDLNNQELLSCLTKLQNARINYLYDVGKLLTSHGYILNIDKLKNLESVTKAHIAMDIVQNPLNHQLLMNTFNHIPSKGEFIEAIMNENCPCYVKKHSITPKEASKIIKQANGKVVLAHPVAYTYEDNLTKEKIKEIADSIHADGIEAYYLYVDKYNSPKNDMDIWVKFAIDNKLMTTIGSDFHRFDDIRPQIGFINTPSFLTIEKEQEIIKFITESKKTH